MIQTRAIGLGMFHAAPDECKVIALKPGYMHILCGEGIFHDHLNSNSSSKTKNERDISRAICDSKIPREEVWVITKLKIDDILAEAGFRRNAFARSLANLSMGYIHLYPIHAPVQDGRRHLAWCVMEAVVKTGFQGSGGGRYYQNMVLTPQCTTGNGFEGSERIPEFQSDGFGEAIHTGFYSANLTSVLINASMTLRISKSTLYPHFPESHLVKSLLNPTNYSRGDSHLGLVLDAAHARSGN
ncbi:hypothetical protein BC830DRAFT_1172343 [Chytriomyces sp. MP71]|nr:hypothetical protein BC830DRAFT_1172343 [Chytriomyces sp. MP71]